MVLTKKFSQFVAITKSGVNQLVGLSNGANAISDLPLNWTTALRPVAPTNGFAGYNTSLSQWEYWNATTTSWVQFSAGGAGTVTLIVAGTGLTGGSITTVGTIALDIPVTVPHGGTGVTSVAAYALVCGGITSSDPLQVVSGLGSAGQVLTSNGAGTLPSWQAVGGSGSVNPGLINQVAYYAAAGSVLSGLATTANGILATDGAGAPSIVTSLPAVVQANITSLGTITSGVWQGTGITVPFGGTGNSTFTAYSVICAGTTATGAFQNVSGLGSAGQVLTSNGAGGLPTWQSATGTGTVNAGSINQVAWYAANGTTVSGLATANNGVLITSVGGVPSISSTLPAAVQGNITTVGTVTTGVWNGTPVALAFGGTNANLTASNGGIFYSTATAGAILAGTATAQQMLQSGASGAPAWSTSTWPATTSINRILYSSAANTVSEIVTAANAVLITDGTGVPSISATLPSAVQLNITQLGTVTTGTWNATAVTVPFGGTGNTTFTAYSVICAGTTATGAFQNVSGLGASGQVLTSNGAGTLPTWQNVAGTGTVNSGTINDLAYYASSTNAVSPLATANGGVLVTSNTGVPSILAGSGTTGTILRAISGAAPAWSTATYPATTTINRLLFSSAANVISEIATGNNGTLITSAGGVPSISSTLPAAVQSNITAVGTITSGTWNGTTVAVANGGTGNTTFTAYSVICGGTTSTGAFQNVTGVGAAGQVLTSNGAASLPTWQNTTGTGTVNSGSINQLAWYAANGSTVSGLATAGGGVLVTSTTGVPSILADPGLTGAILQATSGGTPAWSAISYPSTAGTTGTVIRSNGTNNVYSTSTFADTYSVSTLLYASSANVVTGLATANNSYLRTNGSGVPTWNSSLPINLVTAQIFTSTGAFTYTPTAGMVYILVRMTGAGGGSGAAEGTVGQTAASGPGNGAGYLEFIMTAAQVGASKTGSVGTGGVAGTTPSGAGGAGGTTTFADWTAAGGEAGLGCAASASSQVKAPAATSTNTVGTGTTIINKGTITGGYSYTLTTTFAWGGPGGSNVFGQGGGNIAQVAAGGLTGFGGQARGTGAGGSVALNTATDFAGNTGGNGVVYIIEYCSV